MGGAFAAADARRKGWVSSAVQRRVIVGVDGSGEDRQLLHTALALARAHGSVLYAVDIQEHKPEGAVPAQPAPGEPPRMQGVHQAFSALGDAADDVDIRIVVLDGQPGAQLVRLANQSTDLLVVGRTRRGSRSPGSIGSVALDCVARAGCAVVVVPSGEQSHRTTAGDTAPHTSAELQRA
ncbi:universal stress protein [Pseudonocardia hispaniensis]|uniref:Universal stress protein n=1 Tax=Pseudonocardia hispaniensis TaxID=904933 RepID=A0ABW1J343_9PSEU